MIRKISITQKLEAHLTLLMDNHPDILALIAFSPDGLVITSLIKPNQDKEKISALSAMLLKDAIKAANSFEFGTFKRILLVSEKGYLTVLNVTNEIKIAMLCKQQGPFIHAFKDLMRFTKSL